MSLYPDLPAARRRVLTRDAFVVLLLIAFAWLGLRVYHGVNALSGLGRGVSDAGLSVQSGFSTAASAAENIPLGGNAIAGALRDAGAGTGGNVAAIGRSGENAAHHAAVLLGLLTWALPTALLTMLVLPARLREARRLYEVRAALRMPSSEERSRLLAVRAVLTLPDDELFRRTSDPAGDLLAGRYEALVAAELEAIGVRAAATSSEA